MAIANALGANIQKVTKVVHEKFGLVEGLMTTMK